MVNGQQQKNQQKQNNCSSLTEVYYKGSVSDWDAINISFKKLPSQIGNFRV